MRGGTVQINWHDTKPVLTLDFHPVSGLLATGGADYDIKLWSINSGEAQNEIPTASYQSSLSYHGSAVNILRFSPSGDQLASGADGGELIIWKFHLTETGQAWKVLKSLSFHRKDVLDMEWSTDGAFLVSGSVDNSCIIWDVNKGSVLQILDAHCHYVQGVAWDPLAKYVASLSSDRTCRIYANKPSTKSKGSQKLNYICQHVIAKAETDDSKSAKSYLFHDETLPSFFRRLAWSPDGSFLLVPAGSCKTSPTTETMNVTYVFSRRELSRPALQLPGASKPVVAVRFCPLAFSLRGSNSAGFFKLPYRLIYAVATLNSLYIYDTESVTPIAILAGLHYAAVTDIAWSHNARYLVISSQDGYCTLVEFENDELGSPVSLSGNKASGDEDKSSAIEKPEDMITTTTNDNIVSADSTPMELERSGTEIGKIEVEREAGETTMTDGPAVDSKSVDTEMKEGKVLTKDSLVAGSERKEVDGSRTEAGIKEGKQQLPASMGVSVQNKPAKRRITPMAIDP